MIIHLLTSVFHERRSQVLLDVSRSGTGCGAAYGSVVRAEWMIGDGIGLAYGDVLEYEGFSWGYGSSVAVWEAGGEANGFGMPEDAEVLS